MRAIFVLVSFLFSSVALAVDYYWWTGSNSHERYPSAVAACDKYDSSTYSAYLGQAINASQYYCVLERLSDGNKTSITVTRGGTGCSVGQYDPATGGCVVPVGNAGDQCEGPDFAGMPSVINTQGQCVTWDKADTAATCKYLSGTGTTFTDVYVAFDGDGNPEKPQVEKLGCAVQVVDVANCKMPVPRCGSGICVEHSVTKCRVGVTFTGEVAGDSSGTGYPVSDGAGTEGVCPEGVNCMPPDEPVIEETKPCNYMYNGQVVSCESSEFKGDPGEMNCGTVNGGPYTCTKKVPQSQGIDIKTKITTEPTSDGGTKTTKEDEHTKTVCSAPGSCTTQVTNNKTVTVKDSSGKTVSESGECTGALCDGSGNGKTPGKGGNCEPGQECGTEEEDSEFIGPQSGEVPGFGESLQSFKDKVSAAPLVAGVSAIQMPSGGSCSMGSASTMIGTISMDSFCHNSGWLDPLYYVFLAIGALNAVRILMSA